MCQRSWEIVKATFRKIVHKSEEVYQKHQKRLQTEELVSKLVKHMWTDSVIFWCIAVNAIACCVLLGSVSSLSRWVRCHILTRRLHTCVTY